MSKRWNVIGKQGTAIWEGDEIVAQMNNPRTNHKNARKNAVLMAAAPEMLKALEDIRALTFNQSALCKPIAGLKVRQICSAATLAIATATDSD